ncbi:MAG: periplasmic heavy metal sensor [Pseudomonadota bacterium]
MSIVRQFLLTLLISAVLGGVGVWIGAEYVTHHRQRSASLHDMLHERLKLNDTQRSQIAEIEAQHSLRRQSLELEIRASNADLARAFQLHHSYTEQVQAAIDRLHRAMGELQKETMEHTFAMRSVLTAQQAEQFDSTVVESLTEAEPR